MLKANRQSHTDNNPPGLSHQCGTLPAAGQIVAAPTISSTPTPPKPSSGNGHNVSAVTRPLLRLHALLVCTYFLSESFNPAFTNIGLPAAPAPNLFLHPASPETSSCGTIPRGVNMGWITIVIAAVYFVTCHDHDFFYDNY